MIDMMQWTREPKRYRIQPDRIEISTEPHTDLWQRTYYHFRNDNAPVLQMETEEKFFSFIVKTDFSGSHGIFIVKSTMKILRGKTVGTMDIARAILMDTMKDLMKGTILELIT